MKLDELKKKLYKPEDEFGERLEGPEAFQPEQKRDEVLSGQWPDDQPVEKESTPLVENVSSKKKKYLFIGGISISIIFLSVVGFFVYRDLSSFDRDKIKLEIEGPERAVSGEETRYIVKYENKTKLALTDLRLTFHYPENSIPLESDSLDQIIDLPNLESGQSGQIELPVRIIGLKNETKRAWAQLSCQPVNLSAHYTNQAEFLTEIISVPLVLDFDLPQILVGGQSFNFSLRYSNQADVSFEDLQIRLEYPSGFVFQSAEPGSLENDNVWSLGELNEGEQGKIFIQGSVQGEEGDSKSFKASLGLFKDDQFTVYTETIDGLKISLSPLSVTQTVNDSMDHVAQAGQTLNYRINYQNTTNIGIKNVVIVSKLIGKVLDLTSLDTKKGSFDGLSQTITWNAGNLSALEFLGPGQDGQISFSVRLKDPLPISNYTDKNFIVENIVEIDSLENPLSLENIEIAGQSELITKVASQISLQAQGYHNDDQISNTGPIPPKVGQMTTYTIKWRLVNTSNDLDQVKVRAFLPPHVKWMNRTSPANADLSYNSQTGELIWDIGDLPAATGVLLPVKAVAFQVGIVPGTVHLGNSMELIGSSQVTGQDNFVNLELATSDRAIDTDLPDDPTIDRSEGRVVQ